MMVYVPRQYPADLNIPADPGPLWLDRSVLSPHRGKVIEVPRSRVMMTDAMRTLLITLRERAGMTQEAVARLIDHKQAWLSHIETGEIRSIDEDDFDRLLDVYRGGSPDRRVAAHQPGQ